MYDERKAKSSSIYRFHTRSLSARRCNSAFRFGDECAVIRIRKLKEINYYQRNR